MDPEEVKELRAYIRKAYSSYPKTDSTVDSMIEQAIRSAFVRGFNSGVDRVKEEVQRVRVRMES